MSRPLPILFIHGFNGDPGDWTDGGFRQYLLDHGGLDPDLVRLFRYGVADDGTYNNRGDLRPIAARPGRGRAERQRSAHVQRGSAQRGQRRPGRARAGHADRPQPRRDHQPLLSQPDDAG